MEAVPVSTGSTGGFLQDAPVALRSAAGRQAEVQGVLRGWSSLLGDVLRCFSLKLECVEQLRAFEG